MFDDKVRLYLLNLLDTKIQEIELHPPVIQEPQVSHYFQLFTSYLTNKLHSAALFSRLMAGFRKNKKVNPEVRDQIIIALGGDPNVTYPISES